MNMNMKVIKKLPKVTLLHVKRRKKQVTESPMNQPNGPSKSDLFGFSWFLKNEPKRPNPVSQVLPETETTSAFTREREQNPARLEKAYAWEE